jgi:hypothetical protein
MSNYNSFIIRINFAILEIKIRNLMKQEKHEFLQR